VTKPDTQWPRSDTEMIAAELVSLRKDLLEVSEFVAQLALALGYRGVPPNLKDDSGDQ